MKNKNTNWVINMRCVVTKEVYCENCTQEQAKNETFQFCSDERETGMSDWEIISINEDKP